MVLSPPKFFNLYVGLSDEILTDEGSQLVSKQFHQLAAGSKISLRHTSVESHNFLGLCEHYNQPLRLTYEKIRFYYPNISKKLVHPWAIRATNDTKGPEGLVPTTLVFKIISIVDKTPFPNCSDRGKVINAARKRMQELMAAVKFKYALQHKFPSAADRTYNICGQVPVYRKKKLKKSNTNIRKNGFWAGRFPIVSIDKKTIFVDTNERDGPKPFSVQQLKPFLPPSNI